MEREALEKDPLIDRLDITYKIIYNIDMNIFTPLSRIDSATGLWKEVRNSSSWYTFLVLLEDDTALQAIKYSSLVLLEFNYETASLTAISVRKKFGSQIECELYAKLLLNCYQESELEGVQNG